VISLAVVENSPPRLSIVCVTESTRNAPAMSALMTRLQRNDAQGEEPVAPQQV
jgi:hypothetical protein